MYFFQNAMSCTRAFVMQGQGPDIVMGGGNGQPQHNGQMRNSRRPPPQHREQNYSPREQYQQNYQN